jgi:hypothetical protein
MFPFRRGKSLQQGIGHVEGRYGAVKIADNPPAEKYIPATPDFPGCDLRGLRGIVHTALRGLFLLISFVFRDAGTAARIFISIHSRLHPPTDSVPADRSRVDVPSLKVGLSRRKAEHEASDHKGISGELKILPRNVLFYKYHSAFNISRAAAGRPKAIE